MPQVVIVSPYLRAANNGNWHTAARWRQHLAGLCRPRIVEVWPDAHAAQDRAMIALHARRSAPAIAAWHAVHAQRGLAVVLTGTDLYRDLPDDAEARRSLDHARILVTLQERAPQSLPDEARARARVIFQSASPRPRVEKTGLHLRALAVGHLRDEKSPETLIAAARMLAARDDLRIDHVGAALDPALAAAARAAMAAAPHYRWLGGLAHEAVRRRIQRSHVLVHPSRMEGGAQVIIEAVASGTPVLASRVDGNVGMLGEDYAGYFPCGDAAALAALLVRCREEAAFLHTLDAQCRRRAPLFAPAAEAAALRRLVNDLLKDD